MLTGFEEQTVELDDTELEYARTVARSLLREKKLQSDRYITNPELIEHINEVHEAGLSNSFAPRIRKIIQWLRLHNHPKPYTIVSSSKGYRLTKDVAEIQKTADTLQARAESILSVAKAVRNGIQYANQSQLNV